MNWRPICTYDYPMRLWDYDYPEALFYAPKKGIVIGQCILTDDKKMEWSFYYDRSGFEFEPTHWMPLPSVEGLNNG